MTANQADIDAGKLAESKTKSKDVKAFAQRMVTDHSGVNKAAADLVHKLGVTPEDNPTSQSLKQGGDANLANLKTLKGPQFDRAYIDHEVTYHESVLDALDKTLIPDAQNAELKALLVKVRPAFVAHLEHAKHLQAELGNSGGQSDTLRSRAAPRQATHRRFYPCLRFRSDRDDVAGQHFRSRRLNVPGHHRADALQSAGAHCAPRRSCGSGANSAGANRLRCRAEQIENRR
ncbi:putative outer membrane protein [Paraburkholderia sp. BL23I1N1]|nr:putative outer membrane protein [Paraburkholderia sp. BL23I1N1]